MLSGPGKGKDTSLPLSEQFACGPWQAGETSFQPPPFI